MVTMAGRDGGQKWPELAWSLSVEVGARGAGEERKEGKRKSEKKNDEEKIVFDRIRTQNLLDVLSA